MHPKITRWSRVLCVVCGIMCLALSACSQADPPKDYVDPTSMQTPTLRDGIWAQFLQPNDVHIHDAPETTVVMAAWTENGNLALDVRGSRVPMTAKAATVRGEPGPEQRFRFDVQLLHGANTIDAILTQSDQHLHRIAKYTLYYDGKAPGLFISGVGAVVDGTCPGPPQNTAHFSTNAEIACIYGQTTAADGHRIQTITAASDAGSADGTVAADGSFTIQVPLDANTHNSVDVMATDDAQATTQRTTEITQNEQAPTLTITAPDSAHTYTDAASITVEGTADGAAALDALRVYVDDEIAGRFDATKAFSFALPVPIGDHSVRVELTDVSGNTASRSFEVTRARTITLNATSWRGGETLLQLDKDALSELLDDDAQKSLILAKIQIRPFLYGAIDAIRNPLKYGTDPDTLEQAEYNFYRLLNLSADSADLTGTHLENLADLASAIGLPTPRILANLLDLRVDEPALNTDLIVDVLIDDLIKTHPGVQLDENGDPVLVIRLYDALRNLSPLANRYGPDPASGHPGIIDAIHAKVMEPGFLMSVRATSHLVAFEGADAAKDSKDVIYILDGDHVLSMDVNDDNTFSIVGLVDEPTVNVTISLHEDPDFIAAGTQRNARPDPDRPGAHKGNSTGWDLKPWVLEHIVLDICYRRFVDAYANHNYKTTLSYDAGTIHDAAVFHWDRGWFKTTTAGNLGAPPPAQYIWDTLLELAQVRLHDGGLAEGDANAKFHLKNVPVGIDADDLIAAMRPELAAQQDALSDMLLGDSGIAASEADMYYVETLSSGAALFYYRAPSDTADGGPSFARPGFFSDAALSQRADTTDAVGSHGDTTHRKLIAKTGEHYFFADKNNTVYRLDIKNIRADQVDIVMQEVNTP